eukprot:scaffold387834_cov20-Prasinocladus_malaysianus.AAC.1
MQDECRKSHFELHLHRLVFLCVGVGGHSGSSDLRGARGQPFAPALLYRTQTGGLRRRRGSIRPGAAAAAGSERGGPIHKDTWHV